MPPSEVFFADTYDRIGPLGAKSQGECAINPVAPAIANAVANATEVRFAQLPLTPDRIFDALFALGALLTQLRLRRRATTESTSGPELAQQRSRLSRLSLQ